MAVCREHIIEAYRIILGREPESDDVIRSKYYLSNLYELITHMLMSKEFKEKFYNKICISSKIGSFSQNGEDIILYNALKDIRNGFYIDIGAFDPEIHSVTKIFYDSGWRGINVEPNLNLFKKFIQTRQKDINLNIGIGEDQDVLTYYQCERPGLSTFNSSIAENLKKSFTLFEKKIQVDSLNHVCDAYVPPNTTIDFLKIDTEGFEPSIIKSTDWHKIRPRIICIETQPKWCQDWKKILQDAQYEQCLFDGTNIYFVRQEDNWRNIVDICRIENFLHI